MSVDIESAPKAGFLRTSRFSHDNLVNIKEEEAEALVDRLDTTITMYKMETCLDKTKRMGFQREIKIKDHRLGAEESLLVSGINHLKRESKPELARNQQLFLDLISFNENSFLCASYV